MTEVLCERRIRTAITYGSETWLAKKTLEKKLVIAEMRMLGWNMGKTERDRIRHDITRLMTALIREGGWTVRGRCAGHERVTNSDPASQATTSTTGTNNVAMKLKFSIY